jgi:mono/diheme cytochrome c family protein
MRASLMKKLGQGAAMAALIAVVVGVLVLLLNIRGEAPVQQGRAVGAPRPDAALVARGAYLAKVGDCAACHTARGGFDMAGGKAVPTPFGTMYAPNLTPERETGLGNWSSDEFWRAMHHGRSKDGRLLYPAFPYPNYTYVSRPDSDALYAYFLSLPPVKQANRPHDLRFPYKLQASLAVWRALYFKPALHEDDPRRSSDWNRGHYLVRGLGHCVACHASRNELGAISNDLELGGGLIPMQNWYAPSLASDREAGVQQWPRDEVVKLLQTGVASRGAVLGPMAEVVYRSTQYLIADDLRAIAVYLQALPRQEAAPDEVESAPQAVMQVGRRIYGDRCASCHGEQGEGVAGIYPALAGNRAVTLHAAYNVVKVISHGGFQPTTAGNPRPFGMPPFSQDLNGEEIAAVSTYIRQSWGNHAPAVRPLDVLHVHEF